MTIRDEVFEAAARAAHKAGYQYNDIEWDDLPSPLQKHYWFMASAAIQAAAPHMLASAWDEGYEQGTLSQFQEPRNPYRPTP